MAFRLSFLSNPTSIALAECYKNQKQALSEKEALQTQFDTLFKQYEIKQKTLLQKQDKCSKEYETFLQSDNTINLMALAKQEISIHLLNENSTCLNRFKEDVSNMSGTLKPYFESDAIHQPLLQPLIEKADKLAQNELNIIKSQNNDAHDVAMALQTCLITLPELCKNTKEDILESFYDQHTENYKQFEKEKDVLMEKLDKATNVWIALLAEEKRLLTKEMEEMAASSHISCTIS